MGINRISSEARQVQWMGLVYKCGNTMALYLSRNGETLGLDGLSHFFINDSERGLGYRGASLLTNCSTILCELGTTKHIYLFYYSLMNTKYYH